MVLLIGSLLPLLTVIYPKIVAEYFFLPEFILFHILIVYIIFLLIIDKTLEINRLYFSYFLIIIFLSISFKNSIKLQSGTNEIKIVKAISNQIFIDVNSGKNIDYSIRFENALYGPVDHQSTFNAVIWLYLEDLSKTNLVEIGSKSPVIIEPKSNSEPYLINISQEPIINYSAEHKVIFEDKLENNYISIQKK